MPQLTSDEIARLKARVPRPRAQPAFESLGGSGEAPPTSQAEVDDRVLRSRGFLTRFIREELGDDPELHGMAEKMVSDGQTALELVAGQRESTEAAMPELDIGLEVIVRTDGSRPSYLVRGNRLVPTSSAPGPWTTRLTDVLYEAGVNAVIEATGRIDFDSPIYPYAGTGWLAAPDVIVTNRHVAQLFVDFADPAGPRLKTETNPRIDFGHEFNGTASRSLRPLTELLFAGPKEIGGVGIDHTALDLAVFRLGAADGPLHIAPAPLNFGTGARLTAPAREVVMVGYPFRPDTQALGTVSETDRVLLLLFDKLWGFKRVTPGELTATTLGPRGLEHDCSTLGGNSGSSITGLDTLGGVTGLHYGGDWSGARTNFAHVLEAVLNEPGVTGPPYATLRDLAAAEGIALRAF